MLLTIFAITLGLLLGRLRGGQWSGVTTTNLHSKGFLLVGITAVLVMNFVGPAFPIGWLLLGSGCFFIFGARNMQVTGMIVLMIGLLMNLAPALANGAVPVSERALTSVGLVTSNGVPEIDGVRESSQTASALTSLGDVVPVPWFNLVVSLGDLVILVALGDIAANLMLRARVRELDGAAISYASGTSALRPSATPQSRVPVLSPLSRSFSSRPAHAAHRRPRLRPVQHSAHAPVHAAADPLAEPVIVLDGAEAYIEQPPPPEAPLQKATEIGVSAPVSETADRRPIIDLTVSPTDDQLCEFLRRRAVADAQLVDLAPPTPGHRRNRRIRRARSVDSASLAESFN